MPPILCPDLRIVNSTSYADVAGLQMGMERLPGEETQVFLARLYQAAAARRDHSYQGTVNEIALHLGLNIKPGILITAADPTAIITSDVAGVQLQAGGISTLVPLFTIQPDNAWKWRWLSDVTHDINQIAGFSASLLIPDAPALQVARQSNLYTVAAESITSAQVQLRHAGLIVSSLLFNQVTPAYTATVAGSLSFASELPANTTVTYQYQVLPYSLVCSDVSVIGLSEPNLTGAAVSNRVLAYQIRESIQEIMSRDRSYWSR